VMAKETYYNLEVETMFANAQASKKPVLEALSDAIITVLTELDALRAALEAVEREAVAIDEHLAIIGKQGYRIDREVFNEVRAALGLAEVE